MRQASSKINKYSKSSQIVDNSNLRVRILHSLVASLGFLAFGYVLILGSMVFNIVERKSLEFEARNLTNEVGEMQLQYFSMSNNVDLAMGYALGFKESKVTFATRKEVGSLDPIKVAQNDL